jgi:hypothetical protein
MTVEGSVHPRALRLGSGLLAALAARRGALVVLLLSCVVYGVGGIAWPLTSGRDGATYILYYGDIWSSRPVYPELMLFRTPGAPLFFGTLLQVGGSALVEAVMGIGYALSILAYVAVARTFGKWCAVATAVALLLYPPYVGLSHQVSSDSLFALVFALWAFAAIQTARAPSLRRFLLLGAGMAILVLVRPDAQVFIAASAVPLLLRHSWRIRIGWSLAYMGAALSLLVAWAGYNDARYGDFTVARGGPANLPAYRVFVIDKLVSPDNGPASRAFANVVRRDLLGVWPYRQERVTVQHFFKSMNFNYWNDLVVLSDEHWGWSSDYKELRTVALEGARAHPKLYISSVLQDLRYLFKSAYQEPASVPPKNDSSKPAKHERATRTPRYPPYRLWWLQTNPDNRIRFTATGWQWRYPSDAVHAQRLTARTQALLRDVPDRAGSAAFASFLNGLSRFYPRMVLFVIVGFLALVLRRPRGVAALSMITVVALTTLVVVVAGLPPVLEYRLPFDPLFVLFGIVSLGAPGRVQIASALNRLHLR